MTTATAVKMLDLEKLESAPFHSEPFPYVLVPDLLYPSCQEAVVEDFPPIEKNGSFPLFTLKPGPAFLQLTNELLSKEFEITVGKKFEMDLSRYPSMITVRG